MDNVKIMKPPLKYLGSKKILVPKIKEYWKDQQRLVEPFVGGMSIALGLNPKEALLNDINPYVINLYQQIQEGLKVKTTPYINTSEQYYMNRDRLNQLIREKNILTPECAELYYYLNHTSTNGLCRFNLKGFFNAAKGSYDKINYLMDFSEYTPILQKWVFECGDFSKLEIKDNDFIYADPPYDETFTKYSKRAFDWYDQTRLAKWLAKHPGKVIASNNATDAIIQLYTNLGFTIDTIEVPKRICLSGERKPMMEMFATKNF
jgi:DNA adenine methylase